MQATVLRHFFPDFFKLFAFPPEGIARLKAYKPVSYTGLKDCLIMFCFLFKYKIPILNTLHKRGTENNRENQRKQ